MLMVDWLFPLPPTGNQLMSKSSVRISRISVNSFAVLAYNNCSKTFFIDN